MIKKCIAVHRNFSSGSNADHIWLTETTQTNMCLDDSIVLKPKTI